MIQLVQVLGTHSITVKELRILLSSMKSGGLLYQQPRSAQLLAALQTMGEREGPSVYFNFSGTITLNWFSTASLFSCYLTCWWQILILLSISGELENPSGITIPPIRRWPHHSGFTFTTWLRLDRLGTLFPLVLFAGLGLHLLCSSQVLRREWETSFLSRTFTPS